VRTTAYFREVVLPKRPYVTLDLCRHILAAPLARQVQPDGRVRYWGQMPDEPAKFLRVVTLPDGETVHNAFRDRRFRLPGDGH
jgi:hypothetical protein